MASIRSIDFLPEIFRTKTNEQFLRSTLDQLIQEPQIKKIQGYIGHRTGPGIASTDSYIAEIDDTRQNYQLEPAIVFKDQNNDPVDAVTYPGLLDNLKTRNASITNHDRLFASETYSWAPLIDLDKFINYSQYYWLPTGPDAVDVSAIVTELTDNFVITRNTQDDVYNIAEFANKNPTITVLRGGTYQFTVNQSGYPFWIQSNSAVGGVMPWASNISSREILGVTNNGEDSGVIEFTVPDADAQAYYDDMTDVGNVDLASSMTFAEVDGQLLSDIESINDISDLHNKTIIFLADTTGSVWKINITEVNSEETIELLLYRTVDYLERITIQYGEVYSNVSFFVNASGEFEQIPYITACLDRLYYCDGSDSDMVGIINVVDESENATLRIEDILGKEQYTSPNEVVFTNGMKVKFRGVVDPEEYTDQEYYIDGVGSSIQLLPVQQFVTPESYIENLGVAFDDVAFDAGGFDGSLNAPLDMDYLTIGKASQDGNPWSRSNRWTHKAVIEAAAEYNNTSLLLDQDYRAKRPIIEFKPNIQIFNFGTVAKDPVNIIDFQQVDALSNVAGKLGYSVDGYSLVDGSRIIFTADNDEEVRNKIYVVSMEDLAHTGQERIVLTEADDADIADMSSILVTNGLTYSGKTYIFKDDEWVLAQAKTSINQAPLFDVFDDDGISYSNITYYPATTFIGSKLFSYMVGDGIADTILGFPLEYLNISNLGDIVFENNMYTDTFVYVQSSVGVTKSISDGFVKQYTGSDDDYIWQIGWTPSAEIAHVPQIFRFVYDGTPLILDVIPYPDLGIQSVKVFVDNEYLTPNEYFLTYDDTTTTIILSSEIDDDASIEVRIISAQASDIGYYQVPDNLTRNIFNENSEQFTLGTIRNHYNQLIYNLTDFEGDINGSNNIRDLGDITPYGDLIIQHSSPIAPIAYFIRNDKHNFFEALKFNGHQYEKIKNQIINWIEKNEIYDWTPAQILERALAFINVGKSSASAFYNTDMIPYGTDYVVTHHDVTAISTDTFSSSETYTFTEANIAGLLVYHNDVLLIKDLEYTVADDGPRVTILVDLELDDSIDLYEYANTKGSFIPATPTKLGLYPRFYPTKYEDDTFVIPRNVIRGHDGSITVAYNDIRDDVLLELERRIYNNIKVSDYLPLEYHDVVPGQFRESEYTTEEVVNILSPLFLYWVGWNRLDYRHQDYRSDNSFTWNYSNSSSKLDNEVLKGHWRAIYEYLYDTDSPHIRPWEMVGFCKEPDWWEDRYGPAPYTSGNLVLWEDMAAGIISDPAGSYVDERYVRADLLDILPVDGEGNLLTPMDSVIGNYSSYNFRQEWQVGDQGPVETAWRRSSSWPFAVQQLLALTKPAAYFSQYIDKDLYAFDESLNQFVYDNRYRLDLRDIEIKSNTTPKHSFINWIMDYATYYGYNSRDQMIDELSHIDVNLCYRMAGFTDKNKLKVFTDASSPDSTSTSLLYPDESFHLLLYKNQPYDEIHYSSVIIQRQENGYVIFGNSTTNPYFKTMRSVPSGQYKTYDVGRTEKYSTKIRVPLSFSDIMVYIPYGYIFSNKHEVVDFLVSYGEYLRRVGLQFNEMESAQTIDWTGMAKEFIYWDNQGWGNSSIINLNPCADLLEFEQNYMIVDNLLDMSVQDQPQDQNKQVLNPDEYRIERIGNNFQFKPLDNRILAYLRFRLINFEHLMILDNTSIFNDVMYDSITGIRQNRIRLHGSLSDDWDGQLNAPGFIYSNEKIPDWDYMQSYSKGSIVSFKNSYWVAATRVPESNDFNFDYWIKINKEDIATGLLPNIATKCDQMLHFYDTNTANLESDADLLAFGLTGFRPRDYLSGLDLDDISQVNIYLDMIRQKGTMGSLEMFNGIELSNDTMEYDVLENWAVQKAKYGATASRAYFELQLNEDAHQLNPSIIEISNNSDNLADQVVHINDIYKQSQKHTTTSLIPYITEDTTDVGLPYAGFVDYDDVDLYTYDAKSIDDIELDLDEVNDGTLVWIANDLNSNWNVYRVTVIPALLGDVFDNLNGTLTLEFNNRHELTTTDMIIVKYHDDQINKAHHVAVIENQYKIQVLGGLEDDQSMIENETGTVFKLVSVRVENPSDIVDSVFNNKLFATDKIWVNSYNGLARVYQKENVFESAGYLSNIHPTNSEFGYAIGQGANDYGAVVGDASYDSGHGAVYGYYKDGVDGYTLTDTLLLSGAENVTDYGDRIAMSKSIVIASVKLDAEGAVVFIHRDKGDNTFKEQQIITAASTGLLGDSTEGDHSSFGSVIAVSANEKWLYVGESDSSFIHAYQLIDYENQTANFTGTGHLTQFDLDGYIAISSGIYAKEQIIVMVDGRNCSSTYYDYFIDGTKLVFNSPPPNNSDIAVSRRNEIIVASPSTGYDSSLIFSLDSLYAIDDIDSFSIYYDGELVVPEIDYTYNSSTNEIQLNREPTSETVIRARLNKFYRYVETTTGIDGSAIATTENGENIVIGNPSATVGGHTNAGEVYVYERIVERIVVQDNTQIVFDTQRTVNPYSIVRLNGIELKSDRFNAVQQYEASGSTITLLDVDIAIGDYLDVEVNSELSYVETLTADDAQEDALFGQSVGICRSKRSLFVGAPGTTANVHNSGAVMRFINNGRIDNVLMGNIQNPTVSPGDSIRVNNVEVTLTGTTVEEVADDITSTLTPNVLGYVSDGHLIIELKNRNVQALANRLTVMPGLGTAFSDLGLAAYTFDQLITAPEEEIFGNFGNALTIDYCMQQLYVAASNQTSKKIINFDEGETTFDGNALRIIDEYTRSGVVYTYNWLPDATDYSAGKFVFGEQIYDSVLTGYDGFGQSISVADGILLVSSPGYDDDATDEGRIAIFYNETGNSTWTIDKSAEYNTDVSMINTVFIYDKETDKTKQYLDFVDPLNGRILGAAQENIDYIRPIDPANYVSMAAGPMWGKAQVGCIWWDTSFVKFLDYFQDDIKQATKRWGKVFPGSYVDVYQWIESDVQPLVYTGEGTPFDTDKYIALNTVDNVNGLVTKYYFWVRNLTTIPSNTNKTLSISAITDYIEQPKLSGIPFIAFIKPNVFGLYNVQDLMDNDNAILHIEYDTIRNDNNIFVEYELIREGDGNDMLSDELYQKFLDSFCGVDTLGNNVPDLNLNLTDRYGISFRPRQSMFENRFSALSSYITRVNNVLSQYPMAESKIYPLLESEEETPAAHTGAWDTEVSDTTELLYQNLSLVPIGWKYLVLTDYNNGGRWGVYEVTATRELELVNIQSYDTKEFWSYVDWYDDDYTSDTRINVTVDTYSELEAVTATENMIGKVTANSDNKWELYLYSSGEWSRVALQDGTIEISSEIYDYSTGRSGFDNEVFDTQFFDQDPTVETRNIIQSINEELLVNELAIERNAALMSMFRYILAEQGSVEWLFKTSLIDVVHTVRTLRESPIYQKESQDLVLDYINEVKPYHTKIKDFKLRYEALDIWEGNVTDFDCPAYYDSEYSQFVSPVLDDGATLATDNSNRTADDAIWQTTPWGEWYDNYKLTLESVSILNAGSGYTIAPDVIVTGDAEEAAELHARLGTNGTIREIVIDNPGSGYTTTPTITFEGGNGTGLKVYPIMSNDLVRSFTTTVKYDRYEYDSSVLIFENTTDRAIGDLIRYNDTVYRVLTANSDLTFVANKYEEVDITELSGIDRTQGYYAPDVNSPGLNLALLINGIDFPGVQVDGVSFVESSGFDVEAWDMGLFDNITIGEEGLPTYSDDVLDAIYKSSYTDSYLGLRTTDINVDGAGYVDVYHSHAPEELVPGSTFDTLDMTVFTRPGADYSGDGHGFAIDTRIATFTGMLDSSSSVISFDGLVEHLIGIVVVNITNGTRLYENINYTTDWQNLEFQITNGAEAGDVIKVYAYEIGGGDQLVRKQIRGSDVDVDTYVVQANIDEIDHVVIFINGEQETDFTVSEFDAISSEITFDETVLIDNDDFITITVFGTGSEHSESYWQTFTFDYDETFELPAGKLTTRNRMNAIVEINYMDSGNGWVNERLRPPEARRYFGDGSTDSFNLPTDGDIDQSLIADNEVFVYVDDMPQLFGVDYAVSVVGDVNDVSGNDYFYDPDETDARYITFSTPPAEDAVIDVYCNSDADYHFDGDTLVLRHYTPVVGDTIAVTVFGDTAELQVITEVFKGPTMDELVATNVFGLDQIQIENAERLWVTLNGNRLNANNHFHIDNDNRLVLRGSIIADTDILAVTSMTNHVVSKGITYKYFKDMRDNSVMYAAGVHHETYLTAALALNDDEIHVNDASKISPPHLDLNEFGIVMINGERITFREVNLITNTLSGLRRGTAGTGVCDHQVAGSIVRDMGKSVVIANTVALGGYATFVRYDQPATAADIISGGRYVIQSIGTTDYTLFGASANTVGEEFTATDYGHGSGLAELLGWGSDSDILYVDNVKRIGVLSWNIGGYGTIKINGLDGYLVKYTAVDMDQGTISGLTFVQYDAGADPIPDYISSGAEIYDMARDSIWYDQGVGTPSNGITLVDQTTSQVEFLKE